MLHQSIQGNSQTGNEIHLLSIIILFYILRHTIIYKKIALFKKTENIIINQLI